MEKIGVIGHFGLNRNLLNGQTIKTRNISEFLKANENNYEVKELDTFNWKNRSFSIFFSLIMIFFKCKNILFLPGQNGLRVFTPLFFILSFFLKRNIHYIVIGGWLPDFINDKKFLRLMIKRFKGIYIETDRLKSSLLNQGIKNVYYLPNFKNINVVSESELSCEYKTPLKLVTFSRVSKEKGIEDAINSVMKFNSLMCSTIFSLDIFGQVDKNYINEFNEILYNAPSYIVYKGEVDSNDSVSILKEYDALIFPTYYEGEGFAGTLIDAFASGLPIIASDWKYNNEIIQENINGFLFEPRNIDQIVKILDRIYTNPNQLMLMKIECLKYAYQYQPSVVMSVLINNFND